MADLPNPLTPADCDLAGYRWMPLDVERVIDSDTFGLSTGDEFKTAFRLWAKSWKQVPAASLPNDDRLLAHLAGLEPATWKKRRPIALRGWILCNDGRLYHPVIAEKAIEAMGKREAHVEREQNEETRQQRYRERRKALFELLRSHGIVPPGDTKMPELERLAASLKASPSVTGGVTDETPGDVTHDVTATAMRGSREGPDITSKNQEGERQASEASGATPRPPLSPSVSRSIEIAVYLRQRGIAGANSANPNISAWGDDIRVTDEILEAAISKARASLGAGESPGVNYLAKVIPDMLNPKPAKRDDSAWKRSHPGIEGKASELGIVCPPGRNHDWLLERCEAEIRARAQRSAA